MILIGAKAPIMQGALLSSVLVPFVPAAELLDTMKELVKRIWDFWDEYGNNRERVGELIQRVGMPAFLDGIGLDPVPEMVSAPRDNPYIFFETKRKEARNDDGTENSTNHRYWSAALRKVPAAAGQEELRPVEVSRECWRRACSCHVAESGDRLYTVRAATPRLMAVQTLRKFADLADKYCGGYLRFTSRNNIEFLLEDAEQHRAAQEGAGGVGLPGGRHRQLAQQHRAHAGLDPLPLGGHRCLRHREGGDGRALRPLHAPGPAGEVAHRAGLLPEHVRRGALLRHRHPRHPHGSAEGQPRRCCPRSARCRR